MVKPEYMMDGWLAKGTYLGEWSTETQKPHGRGVLYSHKSYTIMINYWNNGKTADGKYIVLNAKEHWFEIGEQKRDPRSQNGMLRKGKRTSKSGVDTFDWDDLRNRYHD